MDGITSSELRDVNFALGVRNSIAHPTPYYTPKDAELRRAATYLCEMIEKVISQCPHAEPDDLILSGRLSSSHAASDVLDDIFRNELARQWLVTVLGVIAIIQLFVAALRSPP